ncbi:hypothetical protein AB0K00_51275 [Dactylosporangium sp. NPDC049525]|uniref:hypothetical protein n=1 Tax=Dactylosporangium sp. NPDC049525 TaxID=3154730 RepID=UPI00342B902C
MGITEARSGDEMTRYSDRMDAPADGHIQPRTQLPPHTPGAGSALLRQLWGADRIPETTPEDERAVDELIARARQMIVPGAQQAA